MSLLLFFTGVLYLLLFFTGVLYLLLFSLLGNLLLLTRDEDPCRY